jgi:NADPH-dependent ferric siderophore reductase
VAVVALDRPTPHVLRVVFDGPELGELIVDEPAASVRLLLPSPGTSELVVPVWNGNEFLLPEGQRPTIRTFTPIRISGATSELVLDIVLHGSGAASDWATVATVGDRAAISGPGRGYVADPEASSFLLVGDESAVPAIGQLLASLPSECPAHAGIEVTTSEAIRELPERSGSEVEWRVLPEGAPPGTAQFEYVRSATLEAGVRIWAAGEAAAMQRVRRHLFDDRGVDRSHTMIRGYWKRTT